MVRRPFVSGKVTLAFLSLGFIVLILVMLVSTHAAVCHVCRPHLLVLDLARSFFVMRVPYALDRVDPRGFVLSPWRSFSVSSFPSPIPATPSNVRLIVTWIVISSALANANT